MSGGKNSSSKGQKEKTTKIDDICDVIIEKTEKAIDFVYSHVNWKPIFIFLLVAFGLSCSGFLFNIINKVIPYAEEYDLNGNPTIRFISPGLMTQFSLEGYFSGSLVLIAGICCLYFGICANNAAQAMSDKTMGGEKRIYKELSKGMTVMIIAICCAFCTTKRFAIKSKLRM